MKEERGGEGRVQYEKRVGEKGGRVQEGRKVSGKGGGRSRTRSGRKMY